MTTTTNMFIPYVFGNVTAEKITDVIQNYELLGTVDHVDVIPGKTQLPGKPPHSMAFVHMRSWFNNTHAQKTLKTIRDGGKHTIYYESYKKTTTSRNEPFWTVIKNTKVKAEAEVAKPSPLERTITSGVPMLTRTITSGVQTPFRTVPRPVFRPDGHFDWSVEADEDEFTTPPCMPPPARPPRLVRQSAVYLKRDTSATSTVYEEDDFMDQDFARNLDSEFENVTEIETDGLVHESYVKKIENENAKLNARIRTLLWNAERERYQFTSAYYVSDINLSFEQLEQKYGTLTWNTDTDDYTDSFGFVRRIADARDNLELSNHMDNWRYSYLTDDNMNKNDTRLHSRFLRVKL